MPVSIQADTLQWLLAGDVSIQYQAQRDLNSEELPELQQRIASEGWGERYLRERNPDGSWGRGFYQPKWTSSHYTLLDLKTVALPRDNAAAQASVSSIARSQKAADGGINPSGSIQQSDVCIAGMFLNYSSYFYTAQEELRSVVDFILGQQMDDGGFNCRKNRSGARHSSVHSTLSVLEGIGEYLDSHYQYRASELAGIAAEAREFLLRHRLFKSDHTGAVIHPELVKLSFPPRWKYNILRALDHFRAAKAPWDPRMSDAVGVLLAKQRSDGRWPLQAPHPGQVHFQMEQPRRASRWNTLVALRVLLHFEAAAK